jgi:hypothetical protein
LAVISGCSTGIDCVEYHDATSFQLHEWPLPADENGNQVDFGIGNFVHTQRAQGIATEPYL